MSQRLKRCFSFHPTDSFYLKITTLTQMHTDGGAVRGTVTDELFSCSVTV